MKAVLSKSEELEERDLKVLVRALEKRGWTVRREKLARGPAFRVKSGSCEVYGERVLFLDKNLPPSQQLSFAVDYVVENGVQLEESELEALTEQRRNFMSAELSQSS